MEDREDVRNAPHHSGRPADHKSTSYAATVSRLPYGVLAISASFAFQRRSSRHYLDAISFDACSFLAVSWLLNMV